MKTLLCDVFQTDLFCGTLKGSENYERVDNGAPEIQAGTDFFITFLLASIVFMSFHNRKKKGKK